MSCPAQEDLLGTFFSALFMSFMLIATNGILLQPFPYQDTGCLVAS